jgi:uncharacterized protein (DUF3084 family)
MTSFFIVTLIVLPILGGLIAWLGDVIGYRIGRSRRTLFGLRPRATARLIGVMVGAVLPLVGLGVAAVGSEQVRTALLHMDELRNEARQLAEYNDRLRTDRRQLLAKVNDLGSRFNAALERAQSAEKRAAAREKQVQRAQSRLEVVNRRLAESQNRLMLANQRLQFLERQRGQLQQQVDRLEKERQRLDEDLSKARERAAELDRQRRDVLSQLEQTNDQLRDLNQQRTQLGAEAERLRADRDRLADELDDLKRQSEQLYNQIAQYRRNLESTQEALAEQQMQLARAEERIRDAEEYMRRLNERYTSWIREQRIIEESPVVYEPGDEIVRASVSTAQKRAQVEGVLAELLVLANNAAIRRGVLPDATGRALQLVRPLPAHASLEGEPSEQDIIAEVAGRILESTEEGFVVRIRSLERHFLLERRRVLVEMHITPDKVRFRQGEVIDRIRVEPPVKRAEVLRRIFAARGRLREVAAARGLLPDPKTGEYGGLPAEDVMRAVDEVSEARRPVEIRILAARDVRTADPLIVTLEVHRLRG